MPAEPNYFIAPPGWTDTEPNPFCPDGSYGPGWSAFIVLDNGSDQYMTGKSGHGPFAARFGRRVPHLEARLADFLRYEHAQGRRVILAFPPGTGGAETAARALDQTPGQGVVRAEDLPVVVHSTSRTAWQRIQADGVLKAAALLQPERAAGQPGPLEEYLRHEPAEYREYIMFGDPASPASEMVIASTQAGKFVFHPGAVYQPGVRLYFDNHRIIRDGFATRDGLHLTKVRECLPLRPYLLAAVGVEEIDPRGAVKAWTVGEFTERANAVFNRISATGENQPMARG